MNTQNLIQEYSYLLASIERQAAMGKEAPPQVLSRMNALYSRAAAMLSPAEQQQALQAVESLKAEHHAAFNAQESQAAAKQQGYYANKLAQDTVGLDWHQVEAAAKGKAFPRKGAGTGKIQAYERTVKQATQMLGKPNMTRKQFENTVARYDELNQARGEKQADDYLAKQFGERAQHAKQIITDYEKSGIGLKVGLAERRGMDTDHYVEPSEDLQMRAQIATAAAETALQDEGTRSYLTSSDSIDPDYLESEHMTGDIARAMQAHEMAAEQQEIENHSEAEYDIEDEEDVRIQSY
ncbi:hypothetical protein [Pseudohalioglobus lutimaris]|uniref:Uncharacterized protein n=1 Tax=Pseudohalioglobus lutimaris TaxID=1737061 RepID=A0A2N5X4P7_9GAMM|nr:hypothetical protein [Pseudohalioglobus lutimaris]PLW69452.1 hypothetical protein C0039_07960 [Pseudohalioglobus lutimaris]